MSMLARALFVLLLPLSSLVAAPAVAAPPEWLRELALQPVPAQKPDIDAVQLLYEVSLKVTPDGRRHRTVRSAFRLLRQGGEARAVLQVPYQDNWSRVKDMQGWNIPASGKPYEARFKDAVETALGGVANSVLVSDTRMKLLLIPGAHPGDTIGYEFEIDGTALELADSFAFQDTIPVLKASYSLELPPGWTMTAAWSRHAAVAPVMDKPQRWQWMLRDLPAVVLEPRMPSWGGVAGALTVAFSPSDSPPQLASWTGIGDWFLKLSQDRRAISPAMRAKVAELVQGKATPLERMRALATFAQRDIRYVAISLGIGGYQPHAAAEVFDNRFGDCKDKSNLLAVMLAEAGYESVVVLINTDRVEVRADTSPGLHFNHAILAVRLPAGMPTDGLLSTVETPDGARLLFFDPTDEVTPFGRVPGELQGAFGLLASSGNARLVQLPRVAPVDNGIRRTARFKVDGQGALAGEVTELFLGDSARRQRYALRAVTRDIDVVKPLETRLASSLAGFHIDNASVHNREALHQALEWRYSLEAGAYASRAANLLMVRPRVLGVMAEDLSEQVEARVHELAFAEVRRDQDDYAIELPPGYVVDALPDPVDIDVGFAAYRSSAEVTGSQLKYTRSYELRELQVPAARFEDYRRLQRAIARDERAAVVLKNTAK